MNNTLLVILTVLLVVVVVSGCSHHTVAKAPSAPKDLQQLLRDNHGRVLIVLAGIEGCPGTAKATTDLDAYLSTNPENVSVVRFDIPTPHKTIKLAPEWKYRFPRYADNDRKIADGLDFFYYPTLYIFDGDGEKRYAGGCDRNQVEKICREILAEKPGMRKKIYTPPMPAVGEAGPTFSAETLTGKAVTQRSLTGKRGLLVVFSRTSCPFSMADIPQFKAISDSYHGKGLNVVVVNQQEDSDEIKPIYAEKCAGVPVVWDRNGDICKSYGVDAVPFFFLLNEDGKIVSRQSFTHTSAVSVVNDLLGLKAGKAQPKAAGGG